MVIKSTENAGVPLYATSFTTPDIIVSGGGGGQGAHGVKNKLVAHKLSGNVLVKTSEYQFPDNSDSPTSLSAGADGVVWVGANAPPEAPENKHLQKFATDEEGRIQWHEARNAFKSADAATYQRSTATAGTAVAAASSDVPGKVVVVSGGSGDAAILAFDFEINDVALSEYDEKERRFVVAVGDQVVEIRNVNNPAHSWARVNAPQGHKWSRAAFTAPNTVIVASTIGQRKGVRLTQITLGESDASVTVAAAKVPYIAGVTAVAAGGDRLAVASPGGDIVVYDTSTKPISRSAVLKRVHAFPVTDVAVSSNGSVASVSLDGSIVVHTGLDRARASIVATIGWVLLSAVVIASIAVITNYNSVLRAGRTIGVPGPQLSPSIPLEIVETGHGPIVQDFLTPQITSIVAVDEKDVSSSVQPQGTLAKEGHGIDYSTDNGDEAGYDEEVKSPKYLEVPLHASTVHGFGHGPVVHPTEPEAAPELHPEPVETVHKFEAGHEEL